MTTPTMTTTMTPSMTTTTTPMTTTPETTFTGSRPFAINVVCQAVRCGARLERQNEDEISIAGRRQLKINVADLKTTSITI